MSESSYSALGSSSILNYFSEESLLRSNQQKFLKISTLFFIALIIAAGVGTGLYLYSHSYSWAAVGVANTLVFFLAFNIGAYFYFKRKKELEKTLGGQTKKGLIH